MKIDQFFVGRDVQAEIFFQRSDRTLHYASEDERHSSFLSLRLIAPAARECAAVNGDSSEPAVAGTVEAT